MIQCLSGLNHKYLSWQRYFPSLTSRWICYISTATLCFFVLILYLERWFESALSTGFLPLATEVDRFKNIEEKKRLHELYFDSKLSMKCLDKTDRNSLLYR